MRLKFLIVCLLFLAFNAKISAINVNVNNVNAVQTGAYSDIKEQESQRLRTPPPVPEKLNEKETEANRVFVEKNLHSEENSEQQKVLIEEKVEKIPVENIVFEGNLLLTDEEIESITQKYLNKELSLEEINYIASEITELYKSYGIRTALAYVPPQEITNNTINIKIIEGKIGKICVRGNKFTWGWYLKNVIKQKEGDIIFVPEIERDIVRFNKNNDIKLKAIIKKGEGFGESDIVLEADARQPFHLRGSLDNTGVFSTGKYKKGVTLSTDSLLGFRDRAIVRYGASKGVDSVYTGYDVPIGFGGTRIGGAYGYGDSAVVQGALKDYNIESKISDFSVYLSRPLYNGNKYMLFSNLSFNFKKNSLYLFGERYDAIGGDSPTQVRTGSLSFTGIANDKYGRWLHNSNFSLGLDVLGGKEKFFKYNGGLQRVNAIGKSCLLILGANVQLSDDNLPAIEQFAIGGYSSVRGYPESYKLGDYGYNFNTEFRFPLLPFKLWNFELKDKIQGVAFADLGSTFYGNNALGRDTTLMGVGGGIRFRITKFLMGRIDYGFALTNRDVQIHSSKVHFSLETAPF